MWQVCVNIPLVRSNRNKRTTSKRSPQFPTGFSGKVLFHLTFNGNFRSFWLNGKHPSYRKIPVISPPVIGPSNWKQKKTHPVTRRFCEENLKKKTLSLAFLQCFIQLKKVNTAPQIFPPPQLSLRLHQNEMSS